MLKLIDKSGDTYRNGYYRGRSAAFNGMHQKGKVPVLLVHFDEVLGYKNGVKDAYGEMKLNNDFEWD